MVDDRQSDQEQIETIQRWLKANGPGIIAGIALGLAAIGGWQYWTKYQQGQAENASVLYDNLVTAIDQDDIPKASGQAIVLRDDYPESIYAALATFMLAKKAVDDGENDKAIKQFEWVLENNKQPEIQDIARLRLARVLLAEKRFSEANTQLSRVVSQTFTAELEELKGDIYMAQDQSDQARTAYQAALTAQGVSGGGTLLQMKLDSLTTPE